MIYTALAAGLLLATATAAASAAPAAGAKPFAIRADRNTADRVSGCPHQNPSTRPRGSNCYGIFPEQCGADRAAAFTGQVLTAALRARISAIEPPAGVRFIGYQEPVNQDLRFARLNIELDPQRRIARVDCY